MKKLVIVTTDMEVDIAVMIEESQVSEAMELIKATKEDYYSDFGRDLTLAETLSDMLEEHEIDFENMSYLEVF